MNQRLIPPITSPCFIIQFALSIPPLHWCMRGGEERAFYRVVCYEEEGCAGRGANERAADASVYAGEAAREGEAGGGLEAGF